MRSTECMAYLRAAGALRKHELAERDLRLVHQTDTAREGSRAVGLDVEGDLERLARLQHGEDIERVLVRRLHGDRGWGDLLDEEIADVAAIEPDEGLLALGRLGPEPDPQHGRRVIPDESMVVEVEGAGRIVHAHAAQGARSQEPQGGRDDHGDEAGPANALHDPRLPLEVEVL